eukprot:398651_1
MTFTNVTFVLPYDASNNIGIGIRITIENSTGNAEDWCRFSDIIFAGNIIFNPTTTTTAEPTTSPTAKKRQNQQHHLQHQRHQHHHRQRQNKHHLRTKFLTRQ